MELMEGVRLSYHYTKLENPMGERSKDAVRLDFGRKLKGEFHEIIEACTEKKCADICYLFGYLYGFILLFAAVKSVGAPGGFSCK
jgi:hypothetical protein